ncbi:tRNA-dependent cyclodipeptide synthase [Kitasatospora sp. RB6PN24]|uniref:tRNA-dependent cyclodipeptide synthase n=1 Tax=Kitasatospora humi TaxID=2893891 RepID=UPI001E5D2489|nr:tRNA-dependent cyclodipeptide synthase [Kitasatospora humi]MCC9307929.1 tRNA-dependent cyclodipeptide synthase [Kitasatospora humi]
MSLPTAVPPATVPSAARPAFRAVPLTERCHRVYARRIHACIGISPFNGYFHAQRIAELAHWAIAEFEQVHFFVPDSLAVHTLQAIGYPPDRAAFKARRQGQYVLNKIATALAALGVPDPAERLLTSAALPANPRYAALHQLARQLIATDPEFRAACLDAGAWVLDRRLPPGTAATQAQLLTASDYLIGELPLFLDTPGITGAAQSVFCYHQAPRFLRLLFTHRLACAPQPTQGFLQVLPVDAAGPNSAAQPS